MPLFGEIYLLTCRQAHPSVYGQQARCLKHVQSDPCSRPTPAATHAHPHPAAPAPYHPRGRLAHDQRWIVIVGIRYAGGAWRRKRIKARTPWSARISWTAAVDRNAPARDGRRSIKSYPGMPQAISTVVFHDRCMPGTVAVVHELLAVWPRDRARHALADRMFRTGERSTILEATGWVNLNASQCPASSATRTSRTGRGWKLVERRHQRRQPLRLGHYTHWAW